MTNRACSAGCHRNEQATDASKSAAAGAGARALTGSGARVSLCRRDPSVAGRSVRLAALTALCMLLAVTWTRAARAIPSASGLVNADSPAPSVPMSPDRVSRDAPPPPAEPFRLGAIAGVGFPRPLSLELLSRVGGYVGLGAEAGLLPKVSVSGVDVSSWAASGDVRVFPFRGAFFFGLRGGYQRVNAQVTNGVGVWSLTSSGNLDVWFVNPRLGFLWTTSQGFTIGIEGGIQLPVTSRFSTTLPDAVALQVRESTPIRTLGAVLPTVDLLRVGMLF